jgi:hypothetical protein
MPVFEKLNLLKTRRFILLSEMEFASVGFRFSATSTGASVFLWTSKRNASWGVVVSFGHGKAKFEFLGHA